MLFHSTAPLVTPLSLDSDRENKMPPRFRGQLPLEGNRRKDRSREN